MNELKKLNAIHKILMTFLSGEILMEEGELYENWTRGEHVQHTSDTFQSQLLIFQRQAKNVLKSLEEEDEDLIKFSLQMYEKDLEKLKFNIQHDRVNKAFFPSLRDYIEELKSLIEALKSVLN